MDRWVSFKLQLTPQQFKRLKAEKEKTRLSIADLIRKAVDTAYPEDGKK